ncbi:MAG: hypothetical protein Q9M10_08165, partial [Mariprofundaceae bacterium]|nr:hypothetical protein [Mariprofundaceae bacterium]
MRISKKHAFNRPVCWAFIGLLSLTACGEQKAEGIQVKHLATQVSHHMNVNLQDVGTHYITSGTVASDHRRSEE